MPQYNKTVWVNDGPPAIDATNLNKLEQGVFDSLRQDGSTTMSGQLITTAGSAAIPAIVPIGDSNTGIFFPAADTLSLGTAGAERLRIESSGFVGLGLTASYRLDVASYAATPIRAQRSGEYGEVIKIGRNGVSDGAGIGYPADNVFSIITNANERMRITSSGTVGIGTTSPTALVSMHGAPQATSGAILTLRDTTATGANTTYGAITFLSSPGTDFSIGKASENANSALAFRNANTGAEFMRINSSGQVLIGHTSALSSGSGITGRFQIAGTTFENTATNIQTFSADNLGPTIYAAKSRSTTIGSYANAVVSDDILYNIIADGSDGAGSLRRGATISINAAGTFTATSSPAYIRFLTTPSGTTTTEERMRINSAGNVGIGTDIPTAYSGYTTLAVNGSTNGAVIEFQAVKTQYARIVGTGGGLFFNTSNNDRMTITSAGNVGIGTTNPLNSLQILKNQTSDTAIIVSNVGTSSATTSMSFVLQEAASPQGWLRRYRDGSGLTEIGYTNDLAFSGNVASTKTEHMRITSGGNVGIGTTSPTNKLQIDGVTANTSCINAVANTTAGQSFGIALSAGTNSSDYALNIRNAAQTSQLFHVRGDGNVGIGTTSPSAELHVKGTGEITRIETTTARGSGGNYLSFYDPDGSKGLIGYSTTTDELRIINGMSENIALYTSEIARMRIEAGGTTRPAANNTYDLGSATYRWATIYAQNALNTSDARLKTDVAPSSLGLDFIVSLNPVQYRWIEGGNTVEKVQTGTETVEISPAIPAQPEVLDDEGNVIQEATQEVPAVTEDRPIYETVVTPREGVRTHFGLIAQEVKAALPDGLDFAGWCLADKEDADSTQSLGYTQLIAPMIKAIQELNAKVEALEAQLNK